MVAQIWAVGAATQDLSYDFAQCLAFISSELGSFIKDVMLTRATTAHIPGLIRPPPPTRDNVGIINDIQPLGLTFCTLLKQDRLYSSLYPEKNTATLLSTLIYLLSCTPKHENSSPQRW